MNEEFSINQKQDAREHNIPMLKEFQNEIQDLKEKEALSGKTVHLIHVNPEDLTDEDMAIWEKVKDESVTRDDTTRYRQSVEAINVLSRKHFMGFISNKAGVIFLKREFDES